MKKPYTDVPFKVVSGPDPRDARKELPQWFKTLVLGLVALMMLALPIWRFNERQAHPPAADAQAPR